MLWFMLCAIIMDSCCCCSGVSLYKYTINVNITDFYCKDATFLCTDLTCFFHQSAIQLINYINMLSRYT